MDRVQGTMKEEKSIQEEKTMEDLGTQEVLPELKGIIIH
jgi:hypothetical protein